MVHVNNSLVASLEKFAPNGLKLWNVFLPKPDVPPAIAANYRQVQSNPDLRDFSVTDKKSLKPGFL